MNSWKKIAAVGLGSLFLLGLLGCAGPRSAGSESKPLYSGDVFKNRTVIGFSSGDEMECFELNTSSSSDSLFCDWSKAPKANLKLKDELKGEWQLIFSDLGNGNTVCLAKDWRAAPSKISCALDQIQR